MIQKCKIQILTCPKTSISENMDLLQQRMDTQDAKVIKNLKTVMLRI